MRRLSFAAATSLLGIAAGVAGTEFYRFRVAPTATASAETVTARPSAPPHPLNVYLTRPAVTPQAAAPDGSAVSEPVQEYAESDRFTNEGRARRARRADEQMALLTEQVRHEERDTTWAREMESSLREALDGAGDESTTLEDLQCGSLRCSVGLAQAAGRAPDTVVRQLTMMAEMPRARIRRVHTEDGGERIRAILARPGFTVDGEPDGTL